MVRLLFLAMEAGTELMFKCYWMQPGGVTCLKARSSASISIVVPWLEFGILPSFSKRFSSTLLPGTSGVYSERSGPVDSGFLYASKPSFVVFVLWGELRLTLC